MMDEKIFSNGLRITFGDDTHRYFGDYHRVCVNATIRFNLANLADKSFREQAQKVFGPTIEIRKRFERMGVPTAKVDAVRESMVMNFMRHVSGYLSQENYPHQLVASELKKKQSSRRYA